MADAIKFTEDELKSLQELQGTYQQITMALGNINVQRINLNKQEGSLEKALEESRTKENDLAKELTDKYGKGSLDISTGEFTPAPEEASEEAPETAEAAS